MTDSASRYLWWRDIHYGWTTWFILVHVLGAAVVWIALTAAQAYTLWFAAGYFFCCHLSITCAAHRLYAHTSYAAAPALQYIFLFLFSGVVQGPVLWWMGKHRQHHHHTDEAGDPHSPLHDNFFWAHMGWMCSKSGVATPPKRYMRPGKRERDPVLWQLKYYWLLAGTMAFGVPLGVCALWGDLLGGLLVGGFARLLFQYHFTWIVNSAGHMVGERVAGGGSARNIALLGLVTVGEAYHANHHRNDTSWKLGDRWYDLDPGKWILWLLMRTGLAYPVRQRAE